MFTYIWLACGIVGMIVYYIYDWKHFSRFNLVERFITFVMGVALGALTLIMSLTYMYYTEQIKRKRTEQELFRRRMRNLGHRE